MTTPRPRLQDADSSLSFIFDGVHSDSFLSEWNAEDHLERIDASTLRRTRTWLDPRTGLKAVSVATLHEAEHAMDWVVEFTNTGTVNTPILESVRPLDAVFTPTRAARSGHQRPTGLMSEEDADAAIAEGEQLATLVAMKGSIGSVRFSFDEFQPVEKPVRVGSTHTIGVEGSYLSSFDAYSPFFELVWPGGGVVTAIGWSGKWTAGVEGLADGQIRMAAGMRDLRTYLKPGETIRTPRILQVTWEGSSPDIGYNRFRQVMLNHIVPRRDGVAVFPPMSSPSVEENFAANHANQMAHIETDIDGLGFEAYWLDAWWHSAGFPDGMGNYSHPIDESPDSVRFPHGVKPLSDAAHERGLDFLLWFAPETASPGSTMWKDHPEWILRSDDDPARGTIDLGIPEARRHLASLMHAYIREWKVDVWRTDSGPVASHFVANDVDPDRRGMLELRYYEGLYALWDELLAKNPGLRIDNCSGGGTRIDLETMSRSTPLWRTDSSVWTIGVGDHARTAVVNQIINSSLNRYVPFSLSGSIGIDPYYIRSGFNGGLTHYDALPTDESSRETLRVALDEIRRLRKYVRGDFYRLIGQSHDSREWCAYQYHLPDEEAGAVFAFRRPDSPYSVADLRIRAIDPSHEYEVSYYESYELDRKVRMSGAVLERLEVGISQTPGSLVLEYRDLESNAGQGPEVSDE